MNPSPYKKPLIALRFALLGSLITLLLGFFGVFENLKLRSVNALFSLRGVGVHADTSIVVVAVDDESMKSLPTKWPYPRSYFASMIANLHKAGARLIVFDVEFTEPSAGNPAEDDSLAVAVARAGNVILASKVVFDPGQRSINNNYIMKPIEPLENTGAPFALVNIIEDADGFIRRYLLSLEVGNSVYYPLAVSAFQFLAGPNQPAPTLDKTGFYCAGRHIPTTAGNTMYINYVGPAATFRTYSLATVLDDAGFDLLGDEDTDIFAQHLLWQTFKDKIVFVGASAEELQDNKYTPFFQYQNKIQKMPGVEMHANALHTLMSGQFLRDIPWSILLLLLITISFGACLITLSFRPFTAAALVVTMLAAIVSAGYALFAFGHYLLDIISPVTATGLAYITGLVYQTVIEQKEKHRIRKTFQQYVAPSVVEKMLSSNEMPSYGGERKELTILFSDIRRFTKFSESHEPEVVVARLQEYLTEMVDIVFKYDGTLDKFVGDELMALFGAPFYYADHAERACRTALEMVEGLRKIQKRWSADYKEYFNIGVGINTGKVIVGNLGSKQLFDYTVIGDEVNVGARVEGVNKLFETTVLITENTYQQVQHTARVRELDLIRLVGRLQPIRIYELRGMEPLPQIEQDYIIDVFSQGVAAYRRKRWADALYAFRRVLRYFPTDGPSRLYTRRCLDNLENPVAADWSGVHEMEYK